jgi:hypothetical protein
MERILIALALCLILVGVMTVPVMADPDNKQGAIKCDLKTAPITSPEAKIVGSVILDTTASGEINILINIDTEPDLEDYDVMVVYWTPDKIWHKILTAEDVLDTNANGHGNVQLKADIPENYPYQKYVLTVFLGPSFPSPLPGYKYGGGGILPVK